MGKITKRLLLASLSAVLFIGCTHAKPAPDTPKYIAVWAGDEDGQDSDFLAIIDADPGSGTYGKVLRTSTLPAIPGAHLLAKTGFNGTPDTLTSDRLNEAHHINEKLTKDNRLYAGGLISGNIFSFDLTDPLNIPEPKLVLTYNTGQKFSAPDDIYSLPDGNLIATFMGAGGAKLPPALTTPGGLVEFSPDGKFVKEYDAAIENGPKHYRTGEDTGMLANPHGLDAREDLNIIMTSDFADPVSLATSDLKERNQKFRSTVRIWDMKERKVKKVVQVPDGPRKEKITIEEEPEGLMMVRLLHGKDHKGAFTASMSGGALYYCPDVTAEEPVFKEVFDFGGSAGVSVFTVTKDDKRVILPISGLFSPGDDAGFDPKRNSRKVVELDITKLVEAGNSFTCSGDNLKASDCPAVASELNMDSDLNFATHGGPHITVLDKGDARLAVVNYFVDLKEGFGLPGTGSCGDHRLYIVKREGGRLIVDKDFKDEFDNEPGVSFNRIKWPHGETGNAKPHGLIFVDGPAGK